MKKIGRNDPCPCNSGKKYKVCCGRQATPSAHVQKSVVSEPDALLTALEHHQAGRLAQAEVIYRQILQQEPERFDALRLLGTIAYQTGNVTGAIELFHQALSINPDYAEAHHSLGLALRNQGKLDEAIASYRQALALEPAYVDAHHNLGLALKNQGKLDEAIASYREALRYQPKSVATLSNLGNTLRDKGMLAEAAASYRRALGIKPDSAETLCNLGNVLRDLGNSAEAATSYRKALKFKPDSAETHYNLASMLRDQNKPDEAIAGYRQALAYKPDFAKAHNNLGLILSDQGLINEAQACFRQALAYKPDFAEAYTNFGNTLKNQEKHDEAIAAHQAALCIRPDYAEAYYNQGIVQHAHGQLDKAILSYQQAITIKVDYAGAHSNLGATLQEQGKLDDAVASYQTALGFDPDSAEIRYNLGNTRHDQNKLDEALVYYRQALALKPDYPAAHSNLLFCLNYHPDMPAEDIFAEYQRWNEVHAQPLRPRNLKYANERTAERILKIGYVSPDLRKHSTRYFIEPLLAHHDKSQVEIFAYANVTKEDEVSARLKGYSQHWRNTSGMGDDQIAAMIRDDGIDILVDLAGHTANNRLLVFARKPAPLQVSWMGYGYTTGLETIDYFLSDQNFTPPGCEALFSEKLVRLPVAGVYRPGQDMGEPGPLPFLQNGVITFGSLSRSIRINHRVVRVWAEILQRLPNTRLMINSINFRSSAMQKSLQLQFAAQGVAAERLLLGYESPPWNILRQIDITLDCFPHNSGTTLWESLYMGIPFITLAGRPSVGRSGAAALQKIHHPQWIAESEQDYIDKTVKLAADIPALATLRAGLRNEMQTSLLMDEPGFVRSLESAYRTMWRRWCDGLPVANIEI